MCHSGSIWDTVRMGQSLVLIDGTHQLQVELPHQISAASGEGLSSNPHMFLPSLPGWAEGTPCTVHN